MILNFTKLFPKACAEKHLKELKINYDDIVDFHRDVSDRTGKEDPQMEDVIELKNGVEYHFPAIDHGIFILSGIRAAKEILTEFEQTRMSISGLSDEYIKSKKNSALYYIQIVNSLYS